MRAISLVKRIEFEFTGNVARNAVTLGDVDNDGSNELIIGNQYGDIAIYKGREKLQDLTKLGFITCIAVGHVTNQERNVLTIITADGWCYLYAVPEKLTDVSQKTLDESADQVDGQIHSTSGTGSSEAFPTNELPGLKIKKAVQRKVQLMCIHMQRIPANCKDIVLGDVDGDGMIEMVLGLTDRVVRSYRWVPNPNVSVLNLTDSSSGFEPSEKLLGKFVALNKWECANQIGSITLHHSLDGKPCLLIAQPGGTFMRIRCQADADDSVNHSSMENVYPSTSSSSVGEDISGSVDYQFLGITRMRNPNISTEILGDLRSSRCSKENNHSTPYALATLDGTIILVQDEEQEGVIQWAFAVDHQVFALTKLDVTGNGSDDIVVCCWDGQTYILDHDKNCLRFHLDESVQAFASGFYGAAPAKTDVTALVYVTFKNTILIYYDLPLKELTCRKFEPDLEKLSELYIDGEGTAKDALELVNNMSKTSKRELVEHLLYNT